jgi:hypothetical protein
MAQQEDVATAALAHTVVLILLPLELAPTLVRTLA